LSALPERYLELMHAELDGQASHEDLVPLRDYLASHPEAQRMRAELAELTNILDKVEQIETPAELRSNIMAGLSRRRSAVEINGWTKRAGTRMPLIRYGYALAAGVLLGAALTGVAFKKLSPSEEPDLYGSMASLKDAQHYVVTEQIKLTPPDVAGTVEVSRSRDNERIAFTIDSARPVSVEINFDAGVAGLKGFSQQPNRVHAFEAKEGSISFRSEGKQSSVVILEAASLTQFPLNLRFYVDGRMVQEANVGPAVVPSINSK
jgi:hypothetical protein